MVVPRGNKVIAMATQVAMKNSKIIKKTDFHNFFFGKLPNQTQFVTKKGFFLVYALGTKNYGF